ncbi:MAG: heavy metal translocating P-type ATPase [Firmicutes bacterium]|nr:heavy metal translocating P-type ATPase [Bacillota bacterium]
MNKKPEESHNHCSHCCQNGEKHCSPLNTDKDIHTSVYSSANNGKTRQLTILVPEMDCSEEIKMIENRFKSMKGIINAAFYPIDRQIKVTIDIEQTSEDKILEAIRKLGMTPRTASKASGSLQETDIGRQILITTIISGFLTTAGYIVQKTLPLPGLAVFLFAAAIITGGYFAAKRAFNAARNLNPDMNVLMTIAVIGAAILGDWLEASTVVFLFSLAFLLERHSMERSRRAIHELMNLTPDTALVKTEGKTEVRLPSEVQEGEIIIIKPGERIPLDGIITAGSSTINQAPITGESMPVQKNPGDTVFAGTINQSGALEVRVTGNFENTTLSGIIRIVEEAQAKRAPAQSFIDQFSRWYTPIVITIVFLIAAVPVIVYHLDPHIWIYRALVMLMIACPCALVLSTPVAVVSGLTRAAREGILIKGGVYLENIALTKVVALDKTGTLTEGKPSVEKIATINHISEKEALAISAGIESLSEHPLAHAITVKAKEEGINIPEASEFEAVPGLGACAVVNGKKYFIGSHRFFEHKGICSDEIHNLAVDMESEGSTTVMLGDEIKPLAVITISDKPRSEAQAAINELKKEGIRKIVMLTGDNEGTAKAVGNRLGIKYRSELLPTDKVKVLKELEAKYGRTAMAGDGINDAPALAAADVGIAMGTAGSDTALETADIALMSDNLAKIPWAIRLSRHTLNIIKQNIAFALGLKIIFLTLGALGIATLWMAVFVDMGGSLIVIANALRLLRFR